MLIKVKVFPGAKKEGIVKKPDNAFEISGKEKSIMSKLNETVIKILLCILKFLN